MTIEKGRPWGSAVDRPAALRIVPGDAELAAALADGSGTPTAVAAGDLHRTVGGPATFDRPQLMALPIDLVEVTLDDGVAHRAVAHVVARSPWWRGSWWRGEVLVVMNAEYLGVWDVAPRGHPNDGRVEVQHADRRLSLRDRWSARRRLPYGGHVPHPAISTRSVRAGEWSFDRPRMVFVDGRPVGRSRRLAVRVLPDAAIVHA